MKNYGAVWMMLMMLAASAVAPGCSMFEGGRAADDPNQTAAVRLHAGEEQEIDAKVMADSGNEFSQTGVKDLQVENWSKAEASFRDALKKNPKSYNSAYGLAVALEMQRKYKEAADQYRAAQYIESKQDNLDGMKRCDQMAAGR